MKQICRTAVLTACVIGFASGQNFEVVSIRPHRLPQGQMVFPMSTTPGPMVPSPKGNRFGTELVTFQELIQMSYGVMEYQIIGLADWEKISGGDYFDIDARSAGSTEPTTDELQTMLQNLLADRFQLRAHKEKREVPVYALVMGKGGVKGRALTKEEVKAGEMPVARGAARRTEETTTMRITVDPGLVRRLSNVVDRPILDQTGLTGMYEFSSLDWRQLGIEHREDPMTGMASAMAAVQERLGLKLEPRKEPMDVIVIDHAERPSAN